MISITFNFTDVAQAAALFAKLTGNELASATVSAPAPAPTTVEVLAARQEPAPAPKPAKPAKSPAPAAPTAPSKPTAEAVEAAAPAPATSQPAAESSTAAPAAASSAPEITYPDLQKAVLTLHKLDPTAAVPIAKGLGADTFKLLKPEQWAEAHRLVTEAIAARG
jgi:hypothetical protein